MGRGDRSVWVLWDAKEACEEVATEPFLVRVLLFVAGAGTCDDEYIDMSSNALLIALLTSSSPRNCSN